MNPNNTPFKDNQNYINNNYQNSVLKLGGGHQLVTSSSPQPTNYYVGYNINNQNKIQNQYQNQNQSQYQNHNQGYQVSSQLSPRGNY